MIRDLLLRLWMRQRASWQWRIIWLINHKFMVSVAGVVTNNDGRLLLLRHRYHVGNGWGLPGGIVQAGERLEDALAREVHEETGYAIDHIRLLHIDSGYQLRLEVYFTARLAGGTLLLQEEEILEAGWYPMDALPECLSPSQRAIIQQALAVPANVSLT